MKKRYILYAGMAVIVETLLLGCGGIVDAAIGSVKGTEVHGSGNEIINTEPESEGVDVAEEPEGEEIMMGGSCDVQTTDRMVRLHGKLYKETAEKNSMPRCGVMDGEITSYVPTGMIPDANNQANFREATGYQYGLRKNRIEIPLEDGWHIFAFNENNLAGCTVSVKDVTPEGCTVVFQNQTGGEIQYGDDFSLEKLNPEVNEWWPVPIALKEDWGFYDIAYLLEDKKDRDCVVDWSWLYGSLEEGNYRIIKSVQKAEEPEYYLDHIWEVTNHTISCEFRIE